MRLSEVLDASEIKAFQESERNEASDQVDVTSKVELDPAIKIQRTDNYPLLERQKQLIKLFNDQN